MWCTGSTRSLGALPPSASQASMVVSKLDKSKSESQLTVSVAARGSDLTSASQGAKSFGKSGSWKTGSWTSGSGAGDVATVSPASARRAFTSFAKERYAEDMLALFEIADAIVDAVLRGKSTRALTRQMIRQHLAPNAPLRVEVGSDLHEQALRITEFTKDTLSIVLDIRAQAWRSVEGLGVEAPNAEPLGINEGVSTYVRMHRAKMQ